MTTITVTPDRPTLTLGQGRLRAEDTPGRANRLDTSSPQAPNRSAVAVSRSAVSDAAGLRAVGAQLDRASSVADVALSTIATVGDLLEALRGLAASDRAGLQTGVTRIAEAVEAAGFDGVNLLDGSLGAGGLRLAANADGTGELVLGARDLRPGGELVPVTRDSDPATAPELVDAALVNVAGAREALGEEAKRVQSHGAFTGLLSDAVSGARGGLDVDGARLAALNIKQALSGGGPGIAAGAPQAVLSLFR